jgi:hypothetical protein
VAAERKAQPKCGKWMPVRQEHCMLPPRHTGRCLSADALIRRRAAQIKQSQNTRLRNQARIDEIKLARGCLDCGYDKDPRALDFDHLGTEPKIAGISEMITYKWDRILTEIDKCCVRCANCHRIKTHRKPPDP